MRCFDTQRMLEGLSYPRLVECRDLESQLTDADWRGITAWLEGMTSDVGPAAVIDNERSFEPGEMILSLVRHLCELRRFGDRESAQE